MRARFLLALLMLTGTLKINAGDIVKVYEFNNPVIERAGKYSTIYFEGTKSLGEPGKATLPFYPVKLLLPRGEVAVSVSVRYENPVSIEGNYFLMPRQEVRPLSRPGQGEWMVDRDFFASAAGYPASFKPHIETQFYSGFGIAISAFTPVKYFPAKRQVIYFQRVIVTVHTGPDTDRDAHQGLFYPSSPRMQYLSGIVQNPEQLGSYGMERDLRTINYDYLVITKNQFLSEFDTLVTFYRPRGIRMKVTPTEYINSNVTGADEQERIRNYIISEYQASGIEYVMLGGDKEVVPYRGFYCYVTSGNSYEQDFGIPADLYYSALDGNWNTDGDNRWAEPNEDDLYPEVGIGRLTFSDTTELHNMLHKIILYQDNPVEGELTHPLLSGEYLYGNPLTYGSDYMRLLVGYRTDNGYCTHGIPPEHPRDSLYDAPGYSWSSADMINKINSGKPWVHHCGHANSTYVMKLNIGDITNSNFSQANGVTHNYTIVYTHGCICGGFDYTDCIAERMIGIDNMAVAFVGNSRYGWFNQGTTDGPSEHLHREFMDALYFDSLFHIGMAHLKSKSETAPFVEIAGEFEPGATRWCFYDNNVLGDPMMALWTREPYLVEASFPDLIPIGADSVIVQVAGPEGACKNFSCSLYRNDTLFGTALTNSAGIADIDIGEYLAEGPLSMVVCGYNILPQYFTIHVSDYWLGWTNVWSDPGNWYTGEVPGTSSYVIIPAIPAGNEFPVKNAEEMRQCKAIRIEPGAQVIIRDGETFSVGGD